MTRLSMLFIAIGLNAIALATPATKANTLPVFSQGEGKGYYALYTCDQFRATMDMRGSLRVQVLDKKGTPVGKPFSFGRLACNYHIPDTLRSPSRPIISFDQPGEPILQPTAITLRGLLKDDIPFRIHYQFKDNRIIVEGSCEDPKDLQYKSSIRLIAGITSNWNIHPYVPQVEREKILAGCFLNLKEETGGRTATSRNPYWDVMRFRGPIREAEIEGAYGDRTVSITPKSGARLSGHLSPGFCPWSGYSLHLSCANDSLRPRHSLELKIK